jgi:hypothetical protein
MHAYENSCTSRLNRTVRLVRPDSPASLDSPVANGGQSGLSPASESEGFVQPDCPDLYDGLSG